MTAVETSDIVLLGLVTVAACYQMAMFAQRVGHCRRKHKVDVPATDGPDEFVRTFRAQQNCVEFFGIFLACMWMAGLFFHQFPAAVVGVIYLVAREDYFSGYSEDPKKRLHGFKLCVNCLKAFLGMCIVGVGHNLLYTYLGINLKVFVPFI